MKNNYLSLFLVAGLLFASSVNATVLISPSSLNHGSMGTFSSLHLSEFAINGSGISPSNPFTENSVVLATTQDTHNTWLAKEKTGVIYFNFDTTVTLSSFLLWNYHDPDNGPHHHTGIGVNEFSLEFFSGVDGTGTLQSSTSPLFATAAIPQENVEAQAFNFNSVSGVQSVAMTINSNHGSSFAPGFHEVGFSENHISEIPEPSTMYLSILSVALLTISRRKKRLL